MRIRKKILQKIDADRFLIADLCAALDKAYPTIKKYIYENHELLTTASALKAIRERYKLTNEEILEETKQSAA